MLKTTYVVYFQHITVMFSSKVSNCESIIGVWKGGGGYLLKIYAPY